MIIWREGHFVDASGALAADDRGWLIGDAVFETLLVERGAAAFLERHLERMRLGAATLGVARRLDRDEIEKAIFETAARNGYEGAAACRLTLSRVGGPRGLAPSNSTKAQLVVSLSAIGPAKPYMRLIISSRRRWTGASTNGFKCVGAYAENILARADAAAAGVDEAVMLNEAGRVACASSANLFVIARNEAITPSIAEGAMPGIVRGVIIEEAHRIGIVVREMAVEADQLRSGAVVLTNSVAGAVRSGFDSSAQGCEMTAVDSLVEAYQRRLVAEFGIVRVTERA